MVSISRVLIIVLPVLTAGCFVSTGGTLPGDGAVDPRPDPAGEAGDGIVPDLDDDVDPGDALDALDAVDLFPDADVVPDPEPEPPPDIDYEPPDVIDESWECSTVYGDPACDDSNICTADWCDMATHTCVHSGATMEGTSCPDDGNICTNDFCRGGVCVHAAHREGEYCPDDGNVCTADLCASGICTHPTGPADGDPCASDGDSCTTDECSGGVCTHPLISGCCHRDGDCIWSGHIWECDTSTSTCYDPPYGGFCATCTNRTDCGDGGSSSDDWCVYYTSTDRGCSTDCTSDYDCPRGSECLNNSGSAPCGSGETDCICVVLVGTCTTWREFGTSCSGDYSCDGPDNFCSGGHCTWSCTTDTQCPPHSTGCTSGRCGV